MSILKKSPRYPSGGHELATSGYEFAKFDDLSLDQQISSLQRGQAALEAYTSEKPCGFRIPAGNWAPGFADALAEQGISWSSSWRGDDLPYFQPLDANKPSLLVELPLHYELEDEPYFAFNLSPAVPPAQSRIASYSHTLGNMKMDFDGFYRFGLCYVLRLHPEVIGTAGRIGVLSELLDYITSQSDVWVATAGEVADWWQQTQPQNEASHPAQIWQQHTQKGCSREAGDRFSVPIGELYPETALRIFPLNWWHAPSVILSIPWAQD